MPKQLKTESAPGPAALGWKLARWVVFSPAKAAEALQTWPDAVPAALTIYFAYLAMSVVFYSWKPVDFPAVSDAPLPFAKTPMPQSPVFWARVQAWNPLLTGILVWFLGWFTSVLKGGKLAGRIFLAALVWVFPVFAILLWSGKALPSWAVIAVWGVVLIPTAVMARGRGAESWRTLAAFGLSIMAINVAMCPLFSIAVATRAESLYTGLELVMLLWTLAAGSAIVSRLEELPTARAFVAIFFAMIAQIAAVISLFIAGVVSKEILKALMSV
ncbi:MAG: hypothetical protein HY925_00670 [Elusimicrobia bacterium]|nr:hypothetical protein [Elusimicrobiota bacterium]